jgi:hypothetical protein
MMADVADAPSARQHRGDCEQRPGGEVSVPDEQGDPDPRHTLNYSPINAPQPRRQIVIEGRCGVLLALAQLPSFPAVAMLATLLSGDLSGHRRGTYIVFWCTSATGSLFSMLFSMCFFRTNCRFAALLLGLVQLIVLAGLLVFGTSMLDAPPRPSYHFGP